MKILLSASLLFYGCVLTANNVVNNQEIFKKTLENYDIALKLLNQYKVENENLKIDISNLENIILKNTNNDNKINFASINIDRDEEIQINDKNINVKTYENNIKSKNILYIVEKYKQNLRLEPFPNSEILYVVNKGTKLDVISYVKKPNDVYWLKVLYVNTYNEKVIAYTYVSDFIDKYKNAFENK